MPNQPKTPIRAIRLDDDLWAAFGEVSDDRTAAIREFVRWYVRTPGARLPRRPEISRTADGDQDQSLPRSRT